MTQDLAKATTKLPESRCFNCSISIIIVVEEN